MGGTFDPIHNGHLVAASEVQQKFQLDEVVFVPTGEPWMKREVTEGEHRYLMTGDRDGANPRFTVSRVDIDRDGPTYTVDTLRDIRRARPDADLFFITGADAVAQILDWKDVDEVWKLAHFVAVSRPGHPLSISGLPEQGVSSLEVPGLGDLVDGLPGPCQSGISGLVLGSGWSGSVHRQAPLVSELVHDDIPRSAASEQARGSAE